MKSNKAPGEDQIMIEAVKLGGRVLLNKIKELFNLCLFNSSVPANWNDILMVLILKKGDSANV